MACSTISKRIITHKPIFVALLCFLSSNYLSGKNNELSFELTFTYPDNIITMGVKYNPSQISAGISYNYHQKTYFFSSESSPATNPYIKLGADLCIDQLNIIAEQHQKNSKFQAYIQELRRKTYIKQTEEYNHLNKTKNILKDLENHYEQ
jgi:hypothetical protein